MILHPCPTPGCRHIPQPGTPCPDHGPTRGNPRRWHRARQLGRRGNPTWEATRAAVIARDGACRHCGTTADLTAHRIDGGYHTPTPPDYLTLCRSCHGRVEAGAALPIGGEGIVARGRPVGPANSFFAAPGMSERP